MSRYSGYSGSSGRSSAPNPDRDTSYLRGDDYSYLDARPSRSSSSYGDGGRTPTQSTYNSSSYRDPYTSDPTLSSIPTTYPRSTREMEPSPYRSYSTTSSAYRDTYRDRSDAYAGSSRDPYPPRARDRYGSLTVDPRLTAIPERRYESYLTTPVAETSSGRSSSTARASSSYGGGGYDGLESLRYGESAGGTRSVRNARDDDLGRERRREMGLPSETSTRASSGSGWGDRSISGASGSSRSRSRYTDDPLIYRVRRR